MGLQWYHSQVCDMTEFILRFSAFHRIYQKGVCHSARGTESILLTNLDNMGSDETKDAMVK
jgi:hypothetical protein